MRIQFTVTDEELEILTKKAIEGGFPSAVSYTHLDVYKRQTGHIQFLVLI